MDALRFPIGPFSPPDSVTSEHVAGWIADIARLPAELRRRVEPLSQEQLDQPYRPGGWTLRQVVHHLADSHINSVVRFKWALTETRPTIKTYDERAFAELPDVTAVPVGTSLDLLEALHARWVGLLAALEPTQLEWVFVHPEQGPVDLATNVGIYAWHGKHHLAHIELVAGAPGS